MRRQQRALRVAGAVAVAAGTHQLATGQAGVIGRGGDADRNVDSELRFYGAWYATSGLLMLRTASTRDRVMTRLLGVGWLLAAVGRVLSIRAVGRPHPVLVALGVAEAALAAELLTPSGD